mmetsp:Transcript_4767/g.19586  ORF Transcript_4767/g.19586 Transcript_4767/m.19586 type:complete len:330 (-) Transcript_4767:314-1303(-)
MTASTSPPALSSATTVPGPTLNPRGIGRRRSEVDVEAASDRPFTAASVASCGTNLAPASPARASPSDWTGSVRPHRSLLPVDEPPSPAVPSSPPSFGNTARAVCCRQSTPGLAAANFPPAAPSHRGGTDTERKTSPSPNASLKTSLASAGDSRVSLFGPPVFGAFGVCACSVAPAPPRDQQSSAAKSPTSRANSCAARVASSGSWEVPTADHLPRVGKGKCDRGQLAGASVRTTRATARRSRASADAAGAAGASGDRVGTDTAIVGTPATAHLRAVRVVLAPFPSSPRHVSLATPTTHNTGQSPRHLARPSVGSTATTAASSPDAPTRR